MIKRILFVIANELAKEAILLGVTIIVNLGVLRGIAWFDRLTNTLHSFKIASLRYAIFLSFGSTWFGKLTNQAHQPSSPIIARNDSHLDFRYTRK